MSLFYFKGIDKTNKPIKGAIEAANRDTALKQLEEYYLLSLKKIPFIRYIPRQNAKIPLAQLTKLLQYLALLLESGLSLPNVLTTLKQHQNRQDILRLLENLELQIAKGQNLSQAFRSSGFELPPILLKLTAIGEKQGQQARSIAACARYFEEMLLFRQNLFSALLYPLIVLVVMLMAMIAMLIIVVPSLEETYFNLGAPMPLATKMLIEMSSFWLNIGPYLLPLFILSLLGLVLLRQFTFFNLRQFFVKLLYHLPIIKALLYEGYYCQFARALGQLLSSGVTLTESLAVLKENDSQKVFEKELTALTKQVHLGQPLSVAAAECSFIPIDGRQMIAIGEQSSQLAYLLIKNGDYHWQLFQKRAMWLTKLVEPILIVLLGLMLLFIAASLFLPVINSYHYIG